MTPPLGRQLFPTGLPRDTGYVTFVTIYARRCHRLKSWVLSCPKSPASERARVYEFRLQHSEVEVTWGLPPAQATSCAGTRTLSLTGRPVLVPPRPPD